MSVLDEAHYVALKPLDWGLSTGGVHRFLPGDVIPAEEAEANGRAIDNLISVNRAARVNASAENVAAQREKLAAVSAAHAETFAVDAPADDLPGGKGDGEPEETSAPVLDSRRIEGGNHLDWANGSDPELTEENGDVGEGIGGPFPQHNGFGLYELSDGETVRGKEEAIAAQAALNAAAADGDEAGTEPVEPQA